MKNQNENEYEGWPTTRCYPRTLDEAFGDQKNEWCEGHKRPTPTLNDVVLYALAVLMLGLIARLLGVI